MIDDFNAKLGSLCSKAMHAGKNDEEFLGEMIERLAHATAFAIAFASRGDKAAMEQLLMGVEGYIAEAVTDLGPLASALSQIPGREERT